MNGLEAWIINESNSSSFTELSHKTEVIADISQDHAQIVIAPHVVDSNLSHDIKPVTVGNRFSKNSEEEESSDRLLSSIKDVNDRALATEFVQNLLQELFSPDSQLQAITPRTLIPGSISIKKLANSFCQASVAREKMISAKWAEITAWCLFSERFEDKVVELRSNNKKLTDQTARKQIYNEMKSYLTNISIGYLQIMTCKTRTINRLFGYKYGPITLKKIKSIPGYMVNQVICSANKISSLTNWLYYRTG